MTNMDIKLAIDYHKKVCVVSIFLDGKYSDWVEFNLEQLTQLVIEVEAAREKLLDMEKNNEHVRTNQ